MASVVKLHGLNRGTVRCCASSIAVEAVFESESGIVAQ